MQHKFKSALTSIIFVFCVLLFANNAVASVPTCPIWNPGDPVVFIANPENSFTYYECSAGGNLTVLCCAEGTHFCSERMACTWSFDPACSWADTTFLDGEEEVEAGMACGYGSGTGTGTCSCKTGTTTTETIDIYGGIKKTISTNRYCNGTGSCSDCYATCHDSVSYSCECNSGYTVNNQGKFSCNCIQCPAGSYVGGSMSAPVCTPCPKNNDIAQTVGSSAANNTSTSPTSCYLPASTTYTDTMGSYDFTYQCDYTQ